MTASQAEVARLFSAGATGGLNTTSEIFPGYPAPVVAEGELRAMVWGFPLAMKGAKGQQLKPRPVNNARSDKLDSYMWRYSFEERRCLIPVTAFAEAEGPKGGKTRTWFMLPDEPVFAVAGIWRSTPEWGDAYSMVMTDACVHVAGVHDRMPVVLKREDWPVWTSGEPEQARALCVPFDGAMTVDRTTDPWTRKSA